MDNEELLKQIVSIMEQQTEKITAQMNGFEKRINIKIENDVTKRIDALFDGK